MDDSGFIAEEVPLNKAGPMKLPPKDVLEKPALNKMNMQSSTPNSMKSRSLLSLSGMLNFIPPIRSTKDKRSTKFGGKGVKKSYQRSF